jgi:hypothetical protein
MGNNARSKGISGRSSRFHAGNRHSLRTTNQQAAADGRAVASRGFLFLDLLDAETLYLCPHGDRKWRQIRQPPCLIA